MSKSKSIATLVIHAGDQVDRGNNAIFPPITTASSFIQPNLGRVRISTLRNENETFSQLNSITYIGVFLRLVTYSHLP